MFTKIIHRCTEQFYIIGPRHVRAFQRRRDEPSWLSGIKRPKLRNECTTVSSLSLSLYLSLSFYLSLCILLFISILCKTSQNKLSRIMGNAPMNLLIGADLIERPYDLINLHIGARCLYQTHTFTFGVIILELLI